MPVEIGDLGAGEARVLRLLADRPQDREALSLLPKIKHIRGELSAVFACWAQVHALAAEGQGAHMRLASMLRLAQDPERGAGEFLALGQNQLWRKPAALLELEGAFRLFVALRFLEERAFKRIGGSADIRVDVRVIAATNRNLERAVRDGMLREDLYYRLRVLPVRVPPLRERRGDVPQLAGHFVGVYNDAFGKRVRGLNRGARDRLNAHGWPGNVRELKNVIERAMLLSEGELLTEGDLPPSLARAGAVHQVELPAEGLDLGKLERDLLHQALHRSGGNRSRAARLLGLSRHQIRYRLQKSARARG